MVEQFGDFMITDDKSMMQTDRIYELLKTTYWARNWSYSRVKAAFDNSLCFGVFENDEQIAYARCVTDFSTVFWLCDVVVEENHRNIGIGNEMIKFVVSHEKLKGLMGVLSSGHSKELYKRYGFRLSTNGCMLRSMSYNPENQ